MQPAALQATQSRWKNRTYTEGREVPPGGAQRAGRGGSSRRGSPEPGWEWEGRGRPESRERTEGKRTEERQEVRKLE